MAGCSGLRCSVPSMTECGKACVWRAFAVQSYAYPKCFSDHVNQLSITGQLACKIGFGWVLRNSLASGRAGT